MEGIYAQIAEKASGLRKEIINIRRNIYMHPELSGDERRTSLLVAEKLRSCGLAVQTDVGGHGVVGILEGNKRGKTIAWRADMDACAMQDIIDKPYKSKIAGIKHVCGHDAHTAIALGIAETLASIREYLEGAIKFIFQPCEEACEGALRMIKDGVLDNPRPSSIYGLHVTNWGLNQTYLQAGQLCMNYGAALFGRFIFTVIVKVNRENVNMSSEQDILIHYLNRLSRFTAKSKKDSQNIVDPRVIEKDSLFINNEIRLKGSFRFAQLVFFEKINEELHGIIAEYKKNNGYEVIIEPLNLIPPVYNDEKESEEAYQTLRQFIGNNAIQMRNETPPHGVDDFAFFQNEISSGLFFFLGFAKFRERH